MKNTIKNILFSIILLTSASMSFAQPNNTYPLSKKQEKAVNSKQGLKPPVYNRAPSLPANWQYNPPAKPVQLQAGQPLFQRRLPLPQAGPAFNGTRSQMSNPLYEQRRTGNTAYASSSPQTQQAQKRSTQSGRLPVTRATSHEYGKLPEGIQKPRGNNQYGKLPNASQSTFGVQYGQLLPNRKPVIYSGLSSTGVPKPRNEYGKLPPKAHIGKLPAPPSQAGSNQYGKLPAAPKSPHMGKLPTPPPSGATKKAAENAAKKDKAKQKKSAAKKKFWR